MATPKRAELMNRNNAIRKNKDIILKCDKQFPDCPEKPNIKDCKTCPFWNKVKK